MIIYTIYIQQKRFYLDKTNIKIINQLTINTHKARFYQ